MNNQTLQAQKFFLIGSILLGVLVLGGLVWAISLGPNLVTAQSESGLSFSDDNDPSSGPGDAKVVVRMFSDFQCPACRFAEPGVKHAMKTYAGRVRFIWNDFPLSTVHKNARIAANAGRCAEEQGRFWEYREKLFSSQDEWSDVSAPTKSFIENASRLGLNVDAFSACLAKEIYDRKVADDTAEGFSNRVNSTPTFFINNRRFVGGMSESDWDREISAALDANTK